MESCVRDIGKAFEAAFRAGCHEILVPEGSYLLDGVIEIPSDTVIELEKNARITAAPGKAPARRMHMITNSDAENGNVHITVRGGIFDGNCAENERRSYDDTEFVGLMFDFRKVDGLVLEDLEVRNASCYHFRLGEVKNFQIHRIRFTGDLSPLCQDGIHIGGGSENGDISELYAVPGSMGDDLVALNADDVFTYSHNEGMIAAPIRNIHVKNVQAPDCYTGVRLLSIREEITDCSFRNMKIGVREHGINMDAARYCMDPIFTDEEYPEGVGQIKNIVFDNVTMWRTAPGRPLITFETNCENFRFRDFRRDREKDRAPECETLVMRNLCRSKLVLNGEERTISAGEENVFDLDRIELSLDRMDGPSGD